MKSKTEYVRPYYVDDLKQQINSYKMFKRLIEKWINLSIEYSKLKMVFVNRGELKS